MAAKRIPAGTSVKVIGGAFAGCQGTVISKDDPDHSKGGLLPTSRRGSYWVIIELDGRTFEAYLYEDEIEVISI